MPIYEYRCSSCSFQKEYLQKVSDPLLSICPECSKETFGKMLTAAGFQLKGGGWYATDFKNSGAGPASKPAAGTGASAGKSDGKSETTGESTGGSKIEASPAPAAAAVAAPASTAKAE